MAEKININVGDFLYNVYFIDNCDDPRSNQHPFFTFTKMEVILIKDDYVYLEIISNDTNETKILKILKNDILLNFTNVVDNMLNYINSNNKLSFKKLEINKICTIEPMITMNEDPEICKKIGDLFEKYFCIKKDKEINSINSRILDLSGRIKDLMNNYEKKQKEYENLKDYVKDIRGDIMSKFGRFDPLLYIYYDRNK